MDRVGEVARRGGSSSSRAFRAGQGGTKRWGKGECRETEGGRWCVYVGRSRVEGAKGRKSHLGGSASRVGDVGPRETPLFESALRRPAGKFTVPFISPELVGNGDTPPLCTWCSSCNSPDATARLLKKRVIEQKTFCSGMLRGRMALRLDEGCRKTKAMLRDVYVTIRRERDEEGSARWPQRSGPRKTDEGRNDTDGWHLKEKHGRNDDQAVSSERESAQGQRGRRKERES